MGECINEWMRSQSGRKIVSSSSSQMMAIPGWPISHVAKPLPKTVRVRGRISPNTTGFTRWRIQMWLESNASLLSFQKGCCILQGKMILVGTLSVRMSNHPKEWGLRGFQARECTVLRPAKSQAKQLISLPRTGDPQTHEYRQEGQHSIFLPRCIEQNYFHSDKTCKRTI